MNWEEVCEHPALQNLPFKIELNEYGEIVMNAVKVIHSLYQGEIEYLLRSLLKDGKTLPECAIKTEKGTKVADVAWASRERIRTIKDEAECSVAPEICVEVRSASNRSSILAFLPHNGRFARLMRGLRSVLASEHFLKIGGLFPISCIWDNL